MTSPDAPAPRLVSIDRRQLLLRTVDVERLVDDDHCVRSIWALVGRLDLRRYHGQIAAVEGIAGREHTDPQLLISLWLYAYSRGVSSARELARQCEYEPGCQWLCGMQPVSHRTLSGFRSDNKAGLDDLFAQVLGMLSAEGLITLERVTLDGTKIKANAGGNTFRRREKIAAHLAAAREQVRILNAQAENEEKLAKRQAAARRRAARQRASRLEAALHEVERLQREKAHDRKTYVARASSTDPEAHVMRNGEGGTVPSYNVQLMTDTQHGLVVNVEATTDAIDYRQLDCALERCQQKLGCQPGQVIADGDYTNHASVQAAAARGVDFYGSWQDSWKATDYDAVGRRGAFVSSAFPYDPEQDCFICPAGEKLRRRRAVMNRGHGVRTHLYRAPQEACCRCPLRDQCAPPKARAAWRRSITRIEEPAATSTFKAKMKTAAAQQIYAQRSRVAEFAHAWIKERCGLRQFRCRGRLKATMEATWACLSYNLMRWFRLQRTAQQAATMV
ncbi:MAG TPA: IS1182 family transposase [Candidatus Acidoferrales bacterium]|nr:IS1182 family transposase [Candidatus Acidoferrales bacterium]